MHPSTKAIYSSQRRCQEAIDELWSFTENKLAQIFFFGNELLMLLHLVPSKKSFYLLLLYQFTFGQNLISAALLLGSMYIVYLNFVKSIEQKL